MEIDKNRVRDILDNWRRWSSDDPPDPAAVHYYTVSPDFVDYVKPSPGPAPYDADSAEIVEDVMRLMFTPYRSEYKIIQAYWGRGMPQAAIAQKMGINQSTVSRRLKLAEKIFAEMWEVITDKNNA